VETINQIGTFDVENYGDLLYPLVLNNFIKRLERPVDLRLYSLIGGAAPQHAGYEISPLQNLIDVGQKRSVRIVVGGGDLLRTDSDVIAAHYGKIYRGHFERLRSAVGVVDFLTYQLRERVAIGRRRNDYAQRFKRRHMSHSGSGPFLLDPADLFPGSSVSYLSCGAPHEFTGEEKGEVASLFERAQFVYLRDEQSAEKLQRDGVRRRLHVAPDLTVLLSEQFDQATVARKGRETLARFGVDPQRPLLCFQSKPYPGFSEEEIVAQLEHYRRKTESEIVLLPLGYCHDDHKFLQLLAKRSAGSFKYLDLYSVFDIISVIAASDLFIGTSLHGNITAFSFGIPHLMGPLPIDKAEGFLRVVGLPTEFKLRSWKEMGEKIEMLGACKEVLPALVRKAQARVHSVTDMLLENIIK